MRHRKSILNIPRPPATVMVKARAHIESFDSWPEYELFNVNKFWALVSTKKSGHYNAVLYKIQDKIVNFIKPYAVYDSNLLPAQEAELQDMLTKDWEDQLAAQKSSFSLEQLEVQDERIQNLIDFQGVAL